MEEYSNGKRGHASFAGILGIVLFLLPLVSVEAQENPNENLFFLEETGSLEEYGIVEGHGYEFVIEESDYIPLTLTSTHEISLRAESFPQMITIRTGQEDQQIKTTLTIEGLAPSTQYHMYTDGYEDYTALASDRDGTYSFEVDLIRAYTIFIQPSKSTKFIRSDATGGDCESIGEWNGLTRTCTLLQDLNETIEISENITVDGNGHTISGANTGSGIYIGSGNVTVRDITIEGFYNGVYINWSDDNNVHNVTLRNNRNGISLFDARNNSVHHNTIENSHDIGIVVYASEHNNINSNVIGSTNRYGVKLSYSHFNIMSENDVFQNTNTGISLSRSSDNTMNENIVRDNTLKGISDSTGFRNAYTRNDIYGNAQSNFSIYGVGMYTSTVESTNKVEGSPIYYMKDVSNEIYDGSQIDIGAFYCFSCNNITLKNVLLSSNGSVIYLKDTVNSTIENIGSSDYSVQLIAERSHDNIIKHSVLDNMSFVSNSNSNVLFNNNILNLVRPVYLSGSTGNIFYNYSAQKGNYWKANDLTCVDNDANDICDAPFTFPYARYGEQDPYPYVAPGNWGPRDVGNGPVMNFVEEVGYAGDAGDRGVEPNRGVADKTQMRFKVQITDEATPVLYSVVVTPYNVDTQEILSVNLSLDDTAQEYLRDGDLSNGEQFVGEGTFPKGSYDYFYTYTNNDTVTRFPATEALHFQTGHSSVVFLPGIQASRLYKDGVGHEDRLWEPGIALQLDDLMMDEGESVRDDIYTRDIIDEAYTELQGGNVYKKFEIFMDKQVEEGAIAEWKALAYDWRLDFKDLAVRGSIEGRKNDKNNVAYNEKTLTPYILDQMQKMADRSPSDQITIVTHSNGGLLAKYLLAAIQEVDHPLHNDLSIIPYHGLAERIDKVILVAVPQLGTPKAVEALLHGDESEMPREFGVIVDEKQLRIMGEEMTSAYNLMPSKHYFDVVEDPVIEFSDDVAEIYDFRDLYGDEIDNYKDFTSFLLGDDDVREEPDDGDVDAPNVLDEDLLEDSEEAHDILKDWTMPENTEIIQIAGWGIKTLRGIEYDDCDIIGCPDKLSNLDRKIMMTHVGDGTVVLPSAIAIEKQERVKTYYVDVRSINSSQFINREHANILEIDSLQNFIINLNRNNYELANNYYEKQPDLGGGDTSLDFKLHSPVTIDLYDEDKRHTGLWKTEEFGKKYYEANIPNSYYKQYGETKYASGTDVRTITLKGEDLGTFTLEIDKLHGDDIIGSEVFKDIPVTSSTEASIQIAEDATVGNIIIDIDGDGEDDAEITSQDGADTLTQLHLLREVIATIDMGKGAKTAIIKHLISSEKFLEKGKLGQARNMLEQVEHDIEVFSKDTKNGKNRIESNDAEKLENIVTIIKNQI